MKTTISAFVTAVILIASLLFWGFMLFIALDGFSESDGSKGLIVYAIWSLATTIGFSWLCGIATRSLSEKNKNFSIWLISAGMVIINSIAGNIALFIGVILSAFVAEIARTSF